MIAALAIGVLWLIGPVQIVVIPLIDRAAARRPAGAGVERCCASCGCHRSLATLLVLIGGLAAVGGTLTLVVNQFIDGWPELVKSASRAASTDPALAAGPGRCT